MPATALESPTSPQPSRPPNGPRGAEREKKAAYPVSALTGAGLAELVATLTARVAATYSVEAPLLTRARHREALEDALGALHRSLAAGLPELRAEDLRLAWRSLSRITGGVDVEDLLEVIFADFCIGK